MVQVIREPVATYCKMSDSESTSVAEKPEPQVTVKSKRKQLRARITRSIKRIKEYIEQKNENKKRFEREIRELRCDFERARNLHAQLYDFAEETQTPALDKWENELANDVYSIVIVGGIPNSKSKNHGKYAKYARYAATRRAGNSTCNKRG